MHSPSPTQWPGCTADTREVVVTKAPMMRDPLASLDSPSGFRDQSAEIAQVYQASVTMIGRTGFGPLHASDRTISRRCSAENCKREAWRLIPNKPAASEYRQDFVGAALVCRCNDIHVTWMFCGRAKGIICVAAESSSTVYHHGGSGVATFYFRIY
jgi:hypothetical protein